MARLTEPCRRKAYSVDLRWRVVYQRIAINLPFKDIAANLNIATSTAYRTYMLFERTEKVEPKDSSSGREELRKLDRREELYVILDSPSVYLHVHEVCQEVREYFELAISPSISKLLRKYGVTRKKIRQVAKQRCDALRGAFMAQTFLFK